jgi:hypothetical protein
VPNILAYLFQYTTHIKVKHLEIFYSVETHWSNCYNMFFSRIWIRNVDLRAIVMRRKAISCSPAGPLIFLPLVYTVLMSWWCLELESQNKEAITRGNPHILLVSPLPIGSRRIWLWTPINT